MLKRVHIISDPLDCGSIETVEVTDTLRYLKDRFGTWPETARVYHKYVSDKTDVTPSDERSVKVLAELEGDIYCVVYPADIAIGWLIVALVVVTAVAIALRPKVPNVSLRNTQAQSPNNGLSDRTNSARVKSRVPDIFGKVRSTPDLIAAPYFMFEHNQEVEHSLMCIGRGQYEIHDAYDSETPASHVIGTSLEVYRPYDDVTVATPYYQVGSDIPEPFVYTTRSNSVSGQTLRAPNNSVFSSAISSADSVKFWPDGQITIAAGTGRNFDDYFSAGDTLTVGPAGATGESSFTATVKVSGSSELSFDLGVGGVQPDRLAAGNSVILQTATFNVVSGGTVQWAYNLSGTYLVDSTSITTEDRGTFEEPQIFNICQVQLVSPASVNAQWSSVAAHGASAYSSLTVKLSAPTTHLLQGTYTVTSVGDTQIVLDDPAAVNPSWGSLPAIPEVLGGKLSTSGPKWVGPFVLESTTRDGIVANFVASNGLYKDSGESQYAATVEITVEVTQLTALDVPIGSPVTWTTTLSGSSVNRDSCAATLKANTGFTGRCRVRAYRVTPADTGFSGSVVDEVKWRDLYGYQDMPTGNFGDVTVVRSRSYATSGALALKERKLNMLVTRQINEYLGGTSFSSDLRSITRAADIIMHVAKDQKIGNRTLAELDLPNIKEQAHTLPLAYFGTEKACEFCYTFDKEGLSFEETVKLIADTVFCTAYREGSKLKLSFEQATEDSTLLFNHRNKVPGSEVRSTNFGTIDDNDGVELDYVSPDDDAVITYYIPADRSATNPKRVETVGIRNKLQAHFHACRHYGKLRYQNVFVEFEATQEADMTIPGDRILLADNTRPHTQDGEVTSQVGLVAYTSQDISMLPGVSYTVFLQLYDGSVQAIPVSAGPTVNSITLSTVPLLELATDSALYARTTYILVSGEQVTQNAFLVTSKSSQDNLTSKLTAGNYDARFYTNDTDFKYNLITE